MILGKNWIGHVDRISYQIKNINKMVSDMQKDPGRDGWSNKHQNSLKAEHAVLLSLVSEEEEDL